MRASKSKITRKSTSKSKRRKRTFLGMGAEISALVTEQAFHHLRAPVLRVGGYSVPYPPSRIEEEFLPDLDRVLDAVDRSLAY